jgi:hypothetical protein
MLGLAFNTCCRYAEAAAAAKRMQDLKAAQAERLQGELAGQQHSEICQLQERYQQVRCSSRIDRSCHSRLLSQQCCKVPHSSKTGYSRVHEVTAVLAVPAKAPMLAQNR